MRTVILSMILLILLSSNSWSGNTIHNFRLKDIDNHWKKLSELQGENLTVIDFWATWCSPCAKAIPKLNDLYQQYKSRGVQFIGINIDSPKNNAKIKPFARAHKIDYTVLKDPNSQQASRLNISSIPTLLIINSDNEIVYRHQGYRSGDEEFIEQEILNHLNSTENE
ncbi:MAG: TlpA disulfide reductase family protein [Calditrichaceae bacterium]|jgi:cytochrome c biogenesis protein CcmG/thiol:disulfide interchange protein DsbE